jgi:catechol 2,3-dioxygenase-like lactoylglutathione lyase family enzyme
MSVRLEHVNVTVSDPEVTAAMLCAVFDWKIRWRGPAQSGGHTIHVGLDDEYLAVYSPSEPGEHAAPNANRKGRPLNHIGVVVPDLTSVEARVRDAGLEPFGHGDYEPGRRFYFFDRDGIEFEVVSYD